MNKILQIIKNILLNPLCWMWNFISTTRRVFYEFGVLKQNTFQVPIISIGNLTFGGTGKTPMTLWLANYLTNKYKVMVLMRGYKGKLEKSSGIIELDQKNFIAPDPIEFGDEALLLSRRIKNASIVVGKNRSENLVKYFPTIQPDVVILEDGHQHIQLKRNLNIVLFDALKPLKRYQVAPMGEMREGFYSLKDADCIIITRADLVSIDRLNALKNFLLPHAPLNIPIVDVGYKPKAFYNSSYDLVFSLDEIKGRKVILVAGVANPQSFFQLVEKLGAEILVMESFPDHHFYGADEINPLLSFAKSEGAHIVTTEKDIVRIKKIISDPLILFLEVDVNFLNGEQDVKNLVDQAINDI